MHARDEDNLAPLPADELQSSEERYRTFIQLSSEGIYRIELDPPIPVDITAEEFIIAAYAGARLAECNDAMAKMYGYATANEMTGQSLDALLPAADPESLEYLKAFLASGFRLIEAESREIDRYGQTKYFLNNLLGVVEEGRLVRVWGTQRDITDHKAAADALRKSEERYRRAMEAISAVIYDWDVHTGEVSRSPGLYHVTGFRPEDVEPTLKWWHSRIHPDDAPAIEDIVTAVRSSRMSVLEMEYRFLHRDGEYRDLLDRCVLVRREDGTLERVVGSAADITRRKRTEEELRRSEERFRVMADSAPVMIWLADEHNRGTWYNKSWLNFVGRTMEQELGHGWADGIHPEDASRCLDICGRAIAAREPFTMEFRLRRSDGRYRWIIDTGVPLLDGGGSFSGYLGSCIDITDRRETEDSLWESSRRKDEFLAMLAHELRNPLASIANAVLLLEQANLSPEHTQWSKNVISRQIKHLARLIDDLLDVSRITRGKIELKRRPVEAASVVACAIDSVRPMLEERGHQLEVAVEDGLTLNADPTRLEQILVNLLSNAAKYTRGSGKIRIAADREGDDVVIRVSDNGIGIPPEKLPSMFELFTQGERSLARSEGGLGIGLTLVRSLTEMHGGTVSAYSEGPGKGSEFTVWLPAATEAAAPLPQEAPVAAKAAQSARVLIVEDSVDTAFGLQHILDHLGHATAVAHTGSEAVECALSFKPDFVLLDIGLPGIDGYEVARRLRSEPALEHTVIVAVSGYGREEDRRRSAEAGFAQHLVKPVQIEVLSKLLAGTSG